MVSERHDEGAIEPIAASSPSPPPSSETPTGESQPATATVTGPQPTSSAAFQTFFMGSHAPMVRSLSLALADDQLGRDAAAEGFARALARWSSVSKMENPAGWVYRVGLNWARSRRRRDRREVSVDHVDDRPAATQGDAAGDLALRRALARLSSDHRDVVVARYFLDWPERQIAEALGIAPGTVKSRLSRALDQLELDLGEPSPAAPSTEGADHG